MSADTRLSLLMLTQLINFCSIWFDIQICDMFILLMGTSPYSWLPLKGLTNGRDFSGWVMSL